MNNFDPNNQKEVQHLKRLHAIGEQERIIDVAYKHPASLVIMFISIIIVYAMIMVMGYVLTPALMEDQERAHRLVSAAGLMIAIFIALIFFVATYLYSQTKIIITNENLIQIVQNNLLHNSLSRIALTDIEDVYSDNKGYLATVIGYGKLTVETKGEQNFIFNFCPRTANIAKELIDAKEKLN